MVDVCTTSANEDPGFPLGSSSNGGGGRRKPNRPIKHTPNNTGDKSYICWHCGLVLDSVESLANHTSEDHRTTARSSESQEDTILPGLLSSEQALDLTSPSSKTANSFVTPQSGSVDVPDFCVACNKKFCNRYYLEKHVRTSHNTEAGNVTTEHTLRTSSSPRANLKRPLLLDTDEGAAKKNDCHSHQKQQNNSVGDYNNDNNNYSGTDMNGSAKFPTAEWLATLNSRIEQQTKSRQQQQPDEAVNNNSASLLDTFSLMAANPWLAQANEFLSQMAKNSSILNRSNDESPPKKMARFGGDDKDTDVDHVNENAVDGVKCPQCGKSFATTSLVQIHAAVVHQAPVMPSGAADGRANVKQADANVLLANQFLNNSTTVVSGATPSNALNGQFTSLFNGTNLMPNQQPQSRMIDSALAAKLADRVQCDVCGKHVCNKYFLKAHKAKVHKVTGPLQNTSTVAPNGLSPKTPNINNYDDPTSINSNPNFMGIPQNLLSQLPLISQLAPSLLANLTGTNQSQSQAAPVSSSNSTDDFFNSAMTEFMSQNPHLLSSLRQDSQQACNGTGPTLQLTPTEIPHIQFNNRGSLTNSEGTDHNSPSQEHRPSTGSLPPVAMSPTSMQGWKGWKWKDSYSNSRVTCEFCRKELCNKYFLRTHNLNKHGVGEDGNVVDQKKYEATVLEAQSAAIQIPPLPGHNHQNNSVVPIETTPKMTVVNNDSQPSPHHSQQQASGQSAITAHQQFLSNLMQQAFLQTQQQQQQIDAIPTSLLNVDEVKDEEGGQVKPVATADVVAVTSPTSSTATEYVYPRNYKTRYLATRQRLTTPRKRRMKKPECKKCGIVFHHAYVKQLHMSVTHPEDPTKPATLQTFRMSVPTNAASNPTYKLFRLPIRLTLAVQSVQTEDLKISLTPVIEDQQRSFKNAKR